MPLKDAILRRFHYENRKRRDEMQVPVTRKKPDREFVCDFCQEKFGGLQPLNKHLSDVHGTHVEMPTNDSDHDGECICILFSDS